MELKKQLLTARTLLGLSREDAADKIGCSRESYKSYELGRRSIERANKAIQRNINEMIREAKL